MQRRLTRGCQGHGNSCRGHQHTLTHTRTRTHASWTSLPEPMQHGRLLHTQKPPAQQQQLASRTRVAARVPEGNVDFFFMSYSSEPIYFMVQLDGLLPGLQQKVHPPSSPNGGGGGGPSFSKPPCPGDQMSGQGLGRGGMHPSARGAAGLFVFCKLVPRREATDTRRRPWVGVLREERWAPSPPEGNDNHHREKRKESRKTKENQLNLPHCE